MLDQDPLNTLKIEVCVPLTTFWTTRTVDINECLLKELVAYADKDKTVWPSREVENAIKNILGYVSGAFNERGVFSCVGRDAVDSCCGASNIARSPKHACHSTIFS